jgi:hypothetical protein
MVHNDPADLIIPRGISASPSNGSLGHHSMWAREPSYPVSATATASSITSSQGTTQPFPNPSTLQPPFGSYTVRKNSLPDFAPPQRSREDPSPLGYKLRYDEEYAIPPSVPRIPTGRRFEGRERSGSGSAPRDWEDPIWPGGETIRMDAFVRRSPPKMEEEIDHNLFRNF